MLLSKQMFADLEAYWGRLQQKEQAAVNPAARVPLRRHFNPMAIPALLPYIYVAELRSPYDLHLRLAGTALDRTLPFRPEGGNVYNNYDLKHWEFFAELHTSMCRQPCGSWYERRIILDNGQEFSMTRSGLPLAADNGDIRFFVGLISANTEDLLPFDREIGFSKSDLLGYGYIDLGNGVPDDRILVAKAG